MRIEKNGVVVVGLQYGDEGKGKILDFLLGSGDACVRFQGGPNAGHTIRNGDDKHVLHSLPTGILKKNVDNYIGAGCVLDPDGLENEIVNLKAKDAYKGKLFISPKAHIIKQEHREQDATSELSKEIGTTKRGIGPAYADKVRRVGLRAGDIELKLSADVKYGDVVDTFGFKHYDTIYYEGAQGTMLDVDHGTYPYVTSSNTIAGAACTGAGVPPTHINKVIGVMKAYTTRVGSGPFPTELFNSDGEHLGRVGNEYGSTTGRKRRCGWLDLKALENAVRINGVTALAVTKLDVLTMPKIYAAVNYQSYGTPVFVEFPGVKQDITNMRDETQLPDEVKAYLDFISDYLDVPIYYVSVGPDTEQTIPCWRNF